MTFWGQKRVVVTGGAGFLGRHVVAKLQEQGCQQITVPRSRDYDLTEKEEILQLYEETNPDLVLHLAAVGGGIGANMQHPGQFFYENAMIGIQLIEYARRVGIKKFVTVGTVCAYPKFTPVPFSEDDLWIGYPEETTVAPAVLPDCTGHSLAEAAEWILQQIKGMGGEAGCAA